MRIFVIVHFCIPNTGFNAMLVSSRVPRKWRTLIQRNRQNGIRPSQLPKAVGAARGERVSPQAGGLPAAPYASRFHGRSAPPDDAGHHPLHCQKSDCAGACGSGRFGPFHFAVNATQRVNNVPAALRGCAGLRKCEWMRGKADGIFKSFVKRNNAGCREHVEKRS